MPVLDRQRLHLILALVGILLIPGLSWHIVALVTSIIALGFGVRMGTARMRRRASAGTAQRPRQDLVDLGRANNPPAFVTLGRPMALIRLWDAQCYQCQGVGCGECAQTGLR